MHDLVSFQRQNTIVVYKDGSCESLELCLETRKTNKSPSTGARPIVNSDEYTISNATPFLIASSDTSMLTFFATHTISGTVNVVFYKLDSDTLAPSGAVQQLRIARPDSASATLIGHVVVENEAQPILMTLCKYCSPSSPQPIVPTNPSLAVAITGSDKRIFMMPLRLEETTSQANVPGYFVAMLNLFKVDQPLTIRGVGNDCVAIYGANAQQEGASLVLYNTRFNVAQSKQFFKVYFNNARIWVLGKHILLAYGQTLACVSFRIAREQLADMVGSQRNNDFTTPIDQDSINEEAALEEAITFDATRQQLANETENRDGLAVTLQSAVNGGETSTTATTKDHKPHVEVAANVQRDLSQLYAHDVLFDMHRGDLFLSDTVLSQIGSNARDNGFAVDEVLLLATEMEKGGASEFDITERLIPLLIAAQLADELVRCLRKYANISDRMLMRSLKFFLNMDNGRTSKEAAPTSRLTIQPSVARYVNVVLSRSFAADQLMSYLRSELDFSEVLTLLEYITAQLAAATNDGGGLEEVVQFGDAFNQDLQLLAWFELIVDAHYQQFVLSHNKDLLALLGKWSEYINEQIESVRNMKSLSAELYNLVNGKSLATDRQSSKWYSVEMIKLY